MILPFPEYQTLWSAPRSSHCWLGQMWTFSSRKKQNAFEAGAGQGWAVCAGVCWDPLLHGCTGASIRHSWVPPLQCQGRGTERGRVCTCITWGWKLLQEPIWQGAALATPAISSRLSKREARDLGPGLGSAVVCPPWQVQVQPEILALSLVSTQRLKSHLSACEKCRRKATEVLYHHLLPALC